MDRLFNNAGVLLDNLYYSSQQNEMHYEVNTLAPILLTLQLSKLSRFSKDAFVVNTITGGMHKQKNWILMNLEHLLSSLNWLADIMRQKSH